jgi:organic radical activating enzyme
MDVKYCLKTQIVDECNLNCKGCDHFAPLAKPWHQSLPDFVDMIKTIRNTVGDNIKEIELYGGEPLLHQQLYEMILVLKVLFGNKIVISIETNGILLDKFLQHHKDLIDDNKIEFKITEYKATKGIIDKLKKKYLNNDIYQAAMLKNEIKLADDITYKENMFNVNINKTKETDTNKILNIYKNCYCKSEEEDSLCLRNWVLSPCPMTMCLNIFDNFFNEQYDSEKNHIIVTNNLSKKDLDKMAHYPCDFCKRCGNVVYGIPYGISKKERVEWQI